MTEICQKDDKMDVKKCNLPTENGDKTKINIPPNRRNSRSHSAKQRGVRKKAELR